MPCLLPVILGGKSSFSLWTKQSSMFRAEPVSSDTYDGFQRLLFCSNSYNFFHAQQGAWGANYLQYQGNLECFCFCAKQGLPFRGHYTATESGNFCELVQGNVLQKCCETIQSRRKLLKKYKLPSILAYWQLTGNLEQLSVVIRFVDGDKQSGRALLL